MSLVKDPAVQAAGDTKSSAARTGAVSLRNIRKVFPTGVAAIQDFSLEIASGEFVSILGPSGCGKTTMLRCLAGLESVTAGEIVIDGKTVSSAKSSVEPSKRDLGMVFQSYALWPHMTIADNVAYPLKRRKVSKSEIAERVVEALDSVGIRDKGDSYPFQLSGGQQQRVALARALIARPSVILFDEPLSNLDARLRDSMRVTIRDLARSSGFTAVYVTHDRLEAMVMSDRIVLMKDGNIEQVDSPFDLYRRPRSTFAASFLGDVNTWANCQVAGVDQGTATITLPNGEKIRGEVPSDMTVAPGDAVDVLIRVSNTSLGTAADVTNAVDCQVVDAQFLGEYWKYQCRLGTGDTGTNFEALTMKAVVEIGSQAVISFTPQDVILLPSTQAAKV